jgi:hypothetical protein
VKELQTVAGRLSSNLIAPDVASLLLLSSVKTKGTWTGAALAAAWACAMPALAQVQQGVSVTGGRIEGVVSQGVASFKGIPFAASPVGHLRWRAPQPVTP